MKHLIRILAVLLLIYLSFVLTAQNSAPVENNTGPQAVGVDVPDDPNDQSQEIEDDDYFSYDQDILSRKLYEKKLPPLSNKEKIIWSFRLAETNSFL